MARQGNKDLVSGIRLLIWLAIGAGALPAFAQEDHSGHMPVPPRLGTVAFSTSCSAPAQDRISRGVALLHSFGYEEARLTFGEAAKLDPSCAIAYWGAARSWYHPIWAPPSKDELKQGAAAMDRALAVKAKTGRERAYVESLAVFYNNWQTVEHAVRARNYERALADLSSRYPDDDEASIFHALQLVAVGYLDPTDKSYIWQRRGSEVLNRLLPAHPDHPGIAHYVIHATDYPTLSELGLKAARSYAAIAPDSAHALHMPSHIFTRLGLWDDSIASNIASANSAISQTQRLHGGGGSFDQLHAIDYLVYAYLQEARDTSARKALDALYAMKSLDDNQFAAAFAFAAAPARFALERHDWKAAAGLPALPEWFPWDRFQNVQALWYYAKTIGAARSGDTVAARSFLDRIASIRSVLPSAADYDWSGSIAAQWEAGNALTVWAEGKTSEGIRLLREAADHEDRIDKHPVTPGALLPVREMLGDILLEGGNAPEALAQYESVLKAAPRRLHATAGAAKAADQSGDQVRARGYARQALDIAQAAEVSRPDLDWCRALDAQR